VDSGGAGGNTGNEGITPPPPVIKSKKSEEPATGINLSGCFETWGVPTSQTIETARIEFAGLTAQQIKQILQRIPSTFKATLEIAYKDGGEQ
jgi:type III secretory pathway lipoprotein EscJ